MVRSIANLGDVQVHLGAPVDCFGFLQYLDEGTTMLFVDPAVQPTPQIRQSSRQNLYIVLASSNAAPVVNSSKLHLQSCD